MRLTNPGPVHGRTDCQVCPRSRCGPSLSHQGPSLIVVPGDLAEDSALWGEQTPRGQSQDSWGCTSPAAGTEGSDRLGEVERQLLLSLDRPRPLAPGWARQGGIAASGVKPRATGLSLGPRGPLGGGGAGGWDWLSSYQILGELTHTFSLFEGPQLRSPPPGGFKETSFYTTKGSVSTSKPVRGSRWWEEGPTSRGSRCSSRPAGPAGPAPIASQGQC